MASVQSVRWAASPEPLAESFDLLLVDLDGVVYVGLHAVPGAAESLERSVSAGLGRRYVTNNASRPPHVVAQHLRDLGISAADDEVVTSAQEGAELLARRLPAATRVLAIGGPGVSVALQEVGLEPVTRYDSGVHGVLQGFGVDVGWRELAEASYAVTGGAYWVATNPDLTVPTPQGTAPGNGELTAVVQRTTGVDPHVTGKPGPGLFQSAHRRAGGGRALVVGDRLDTDIAGAVAAGLPSLLVLTGVTGVAELLSASAGERPSYLSRDLFGLWQGHPDARFQDGWWVCGQDRARAHEGRLEVEGVVEEVGRVQASGDGLDLLRAAAAAAWEAADKAADIDVIAAIDRLERPGR